MEPGLLLLAIVANVITLGLIWAREGRTGVRGGASAPTDSAPHPVPDRAGRQPSVGMVKESVRPAGPPLTPGWEWRGSLPDGEAVRAERALQARGMFAVWFGRDDAPWLLLREHLQLLIDLCAFSAVVERNTADPDPARRAGRQDGKGRPCVRNLSMEAISRLPDAAGLLVRHWRPAEFAGWAQRAGDLRRWIARELLLDAVRAREPRSATARKLAEHMLRELAEAAGDAEDAGYRMLLGTWHVHRELLTRSIEGQPTVPRVDAPLLARLAREAEVHIPAPAIVPPAPRPRKPRTCRSAAYRPPNGVGHGGAATGLPRLLSGWNEGVHVYLDARPWSERREPVVVGIGRQPGFQLRLTGDELHRLWLALIMALACPNPRWHEIHLALSGAVAGRPVEHTLAALEASVDPGAGTHREDQR